MIKLVVKNQVSMKVYPYARGLCLPGVEYHSSCPKCKKTVIIPGEDYFLSEEVTSDQTEWCMPTFECQDCQWVWEEEFKLELSIKVKITPHQSHIGYRS